LLEALEERTVPAIIVVNTTADDAALDSLRAAIMSINQQSDVNPNIQRTGDYTNTLGPVPWGYDTIQFAPSLAGQTVNLLQIGDMTLGPTALPVGLSTSQSSSILIDGTNSPGLTISGGPAGTNLRLFYVHANSSLALKHLTVSDGQARGGMGEFPGGGGGGGLGGAVFSEGTVGVVRCTFLDNQAVGGDGGEGFSRNLGGAGGGPNGGLGGNMTNGGDGGFGGGGGGGGNFSQGGAGGFGGGGGGAGADGVPRQRRLRRRWRRR